MFQFSINSISGKGLLALCQWDVVVTPSMASAFRVVAGTGGFADSAAAAIERRIDEPLKPGHKRYVCDFITGDVASLKGSLEQACAAANAALGLAA